MSKNVDQLVLPIHTVSINEHIFFANLSVYLFFNFFFNFQGANYSGDIERK